MRTVAPLVLLAGCDLVFPLNDPAGTQPGTGVQLRRTFDAGESTTTRLRIDRPADIEPDDFLVMMVKGGGGDALDDNIEMLARPAGLDIITSVNAEGCPADAYRTFFLRGRAGTGNMYEFEFDTETDYVALGAAYTKAGSAAVITQLSAQQLIVAAATKVDLPTAQSSPGSVVWIGAAAGQEWVDLFTEATKQAVSENLAVFDYVVPEGGVVPPMSYSLGTTALDFCPGVVQLRVELDPGL